eukprot:SAG31_NODE_22297_length_529_cov_0.723256_2_plen_68_part_01
MSNVFGMNKSRARLEIDIGDTDTPRLSSHVIIKTRHKFKYCHLLLALASYGSAGTRPPHRTSPHTAEP